MTQEEATAIYLKKFPLPNECYTDTVWQNKNGWNFKRTCQVNGFRDEEDVHQIQVREDGKMYKAGNLIQ